MTMLFLDIETLPTTDPEIIANIDDSIKAPATHKKTETIAAWMAENKEQAIKDAVAKTSFDGLYGSIACICYAIDDGDVFSIDANSSINEIGMLVDFYRQIDKITGVDHYSGTVQKNITVVGHNIAGFDLPFLKHRSIINGVKPTPGLLKAMSAKPWDGCIADTMLMWSSDSQKRVSMDKLCKAFGIPGKGDFDGSMVADTWSTDPKKVISYCKEDVERTRMLYKRMMFIDSAQGIK